MAPMIQTGTSNSSPPISDSDNSSKSHIGLPSPIKITSEGGVEEEEGQEKEKDTLVIGKVVVNNNIIAMNNKDKKSEDYDNDNADIVVCDLDELKNSNRTSVEENQEAIVQMILPLTLTLRSELYKQK